MLVEPHFSQQHAGLQQAVVFQPQQEVTKPKARFKFTSEESLVLTLVHVAKLQWAGAQFL